MAAKRRADQLLVEQGLAESRAKAQALILAGLVSTGGRRIDKPGTALADDTELALAGRDHPWVSRGGVKLGFALDHFAIDPDGLTALDIGRGQLAWKLRQDPRVVVHEGINARYLSRAEIPDPIDLLTCDASFIGLATVL